MTHLSSANFRSGSSVSLTGFASTPALHLRAGRLARWSTARVWRTLASESRFVSSWRRLSSTSYGPSEAIARLPICAGSSRGSGRSSRSSSSPRSRRGSSSAGPLGRRGVERSRVRVRLGDKARGGVLRVALGPAEQLAPVLGPALRVASAKGAERVRVRAAAVARADAFRHRALPRPCPDSCSTAVGTDGTKRSYRSNYRSLTRTFAGGAGRDRTCDPGIMSPPL